MFKVSRAPFHLFTASVIFCVTAGFSLIINPVSANELANENNNTVRVFITAESPSVAEMVAAAKAAHHRTPNRQKQLRHAQLLDREQDQLAQRIKPLIKTEHSRLTVALNGFRATVQRDQLDALRATKGVKSVAPIRHMTPDNEFSVPWVQAPRLWENVGNGQNITVAVIDTGIDYLHKNFGGNGDPTQYEVNDFSVIEPGSFPTAKVIGGWDFAGPTYNSRIDDKPLPDPDPLDGNGHGSHVAGTVAGFGVDGLIGRGVAYGANLLALKVFSDIGGSTDLTADAIEMALDPNGDGSMDDHVDVINMSLGARFGLPTDPSALASSHASQAGVIVVTSAGNSGALPYVTGSPGVSPEAISVAASISGGRRLLAVNTDLPFGSVLPSRQGAGEIRVQPEAIEGQLVLAQNRDDEKGLLINDGCTVLINKDDINTNIALMRRGGCNFPLKYLNAQKAGAKAMLLINSSVRIGDLFVMGGLDDTITIPGAMITLADGNRVLEAIDSGVAVNASLSSLETVPGSTELNDVMTSFSSSGPSGGNVAFKPDLSAPGRFIISTEAGTGVLGRERRGTSMAAPHVAGMAALLRQQHPTLPPSAIKSLLQNSASVSFDDGPGGNIAAPLSRQGVGVMRGGDASRLTTYAQPGAVSFAYLNVTEDARHKQSFTLHNLSDKARTFSVQQVKAVQTPGVTVHCPKQISVDAASQVVATIGLTIDVTQLENDDASFSQPETSGWCVLRDKEQIIRVGYMSAVDGASDVQISRSDTQLTLSNTGPVDAVAHSFVLSANTASYLKRHDQSKASSTSSGIAQVGWRNNEEFGFPQLEFAIAMAQPWQTPSRLRWFMFVDVDFDGHYERVLYALDWSWLGFDPGNIITGVDFVRDYEDFPTERNIANWLTEDADYNDRVIILPFFSTDSGVNAIFKPQERRFDFKLIAIDRDGSEYIATGTIDRDNPAANQQHELSIASGQSIELPLADHDQLWVVPTNQQRDQSLVAPVFNTRYLDAP